MSSDAVAVDGIYDAVATPRKTIRKKNREKGGVGCSGETGENHRGNDPLMAFGPDIMTMILNNLDARGGVVALLVSRGWHEVGSSDKLWTRKCDDLWLGKAHIPRVSQAPGLSKLAAYSLSVSDGKRNRIVREDLCDHAWDFHFSKVAPPYWRDLDPHWGGMGPRMRRHFHTDGSQSADPNDLVWGGHEASYCTVTSFLGNNEIRKHYVRINRWPEMYVSRNLDWSWQMSNYLCSYSSIPDAGKKGGTGPLIPVPRSPPPCLYLEQGRIF